MPWPIDIVKLSQTYPECVRLEKQIVVVCVEIFIFFFSYEPEIHPGATVRLINKAVLKVFTTGSVTLTGNQR